VSRQGPAQLSKRETLVPASSSNEQNRTKYRKRRLAERQLSIVGNSSSLKMQVFEEITHVVLNSLGDHVVRASPAHIAIAHVSIDHCNLPHQAVLLGVWGMVARWSVILARFSPLHAIIFAEAGEKLKAASAAATSKFFIVVSRV
jgi:hypothetical protein